MLALTAYDSIGHVVELQLASKPWWKFWRRRRLSGRFQIADVQGVNEGGALRRTVVLVELAPDWPPHGLKLRQP